MVGVNQPRTKKWINRPYLLPGSLSYSSQSIFPMGENFRARNLGVKQSWHSHLSLMAHKKISIWCCLNRLQVSHDDLPYWEIPQHWGTLQLWPAASRDNHLQIRCSGITADCFRQNVLPRLCLPFKFQFWDILEIQAYSEIHRQCLWLLWQL